MLMFKRSQLYIGLGLAAVVEIIIGRRASRQAAS